MIQRVPARKVKLVRVSMLLSESGFRCTIIPIDAVERELTYKIPPTKIHEGVTIYKEELMQIRTAQHEEPEIYHYVYCFAVDMADAVELLETTVCQKFIELKKKVEAMDAAIAAGCHRVDETKQIDHAEID